MSGAQDSTLGPFLEGVRRDVDATLDRRVPAETVAPTSIHRAMRYSLFAGGKRIRPALVVLAGDVLGVERSAALEGGAALEMIHTYSLIHDDLPALDDDDLRRGRPSLHKQFDEATAILAGDSLLTLGLTQLAMHPAAIPDERRRAAVEMVGTAIGSQGMIGGQVDDLAATERWPDDPAAMLEAIHRRKTGALLTACVELAGIYAGVAEDQRKRLTEIGDLIGLMFQIADDILDVEGTSGSLGKTAGKDAAAHKLTYPELHGLEESKTLLARSRDEARTLALELPRGGGLFPALIDYLTTRDH